MKFLFVADSFKGSLTSKDIIFLLTKASQEVFSKCECIGVPLAEGGDGTIDAVIASENGQKIHTKTHDPLINEIESCYGVSRDNKAVNCQNIYHSYFE